MRMRTIIVDDERIARERLRRLLAVHPEVEIVTECADGHSAVAAAGEYHPDFLLLDVQMPGLDGFGVVETLGPDHSPCVVFVTAFDQHAIRAFDVCALDYLLKPATPERLARSLQRVAAHLAVHRTPEAPAAPPEPSGAPRYTVRSGQRTIIVSADDILWIEADGNYAILHTAAGHHLLRHTMAGLERQLAGIGFFRLSRSVIGDLKRVRELRAAGDGHHEAVLATGQTIPITRSIREVKDQWLKWPRPR